jgi:hypothetical protein
MFLKIWIKGFDSKPFSCAFYLKHGSNCSNSQVLQRQEINLVLKIKVFFLGSKTWYFNNFDLFLFSKKLGCYNLPPLKRISSRDSQVEIERD